MKTSQRLKAAEDALEAIMADDVLADTLPKKIARKIDNWKATQLAELQKPERK